MKKLIMVKGLPASGKSTWAREMCLKGYKRVNKDDLRAMIDNSHWSKDNEKNIVIVRNLIVGQYLGEGCHVIVDDTNLDPKHEIDLRNIAKEWGAKFEIKDFTDVPLDVCLERDRKRNPSVGKDVIMGMYNRYLKPEVKKIENNPELPYRIICDLDGTLALHNGRGPYEIEKCETDLVNRPIWNILTIYGLDYVIFVSGREDKYRPETERWLADLFPKKPLLFMRKTDDLRNDAIIKREIYEAEIKDKFNIDFVLDDRDRVVRMWRELGLTCLQVAEGDF